MDTLDRYLLKEFFLFFLVALLGLGTLYLGVDFMTNFWDLSARMSTSRVLELYLCRVPQALQMFFPVACLMAMLLVLATMSRQNEVLALYASGVGPLRVVSTFIAAVALCSTVSFLAFDSVIPMVNKRRILIQKGLDPDKAELQTHFQGSFWLKSGSRIYSIDRFVPEANRLEGVDVYWLTPHFELLQRTHAKEAVFNGQDWELKKGFTVVYPPETHYPEMSTFETKGNLIREKPADFRSLTFQEETMRLKDLRRYINRNASSGLDTTGQQVSYHERVALVFTPLVLLLLGFPYALKPLNRNQSMPKSIAFCFLVVFLYLLLQRMSLCFGKGGHIPPVMAAWTPNLLFLGLAVLLLTRRT